MPATRDQKNGMISDIMNIDFDILDQKENDAQPYDYVALHFDEAVGRRWFKVYFQPAYRSLSGKIDHLKAIPRWEDPAYGIIMPDQFLPTVKERKKLYRLDLYILESVCKVIHDSGNLCRIAIPLSSDTLAIPDLHERILHSCAKFFVPHELLCIGISEETAAGDLLAAERQIYRFHEEGFEVWLYDFGT